jgi:hypothetical protein
MQFTVARVTGFDHVVLILSSEPMLGPEQGSEPTGEHFRNHGFCGAATGVERGLIGEQAQTGFRPLLPRLLPEDVQPDGNVQHSAISSYSFYIGHPTVVKEGEGTLIHHQGIVCGVAQPEAGKLRRSSAPSI